MKCKICGTEFPAIKDKHYITRDNGVNGGLSQSLNGKQEEKLYDCFDCPNCGCQVIAQERKRNFEPDNICDFSDDECEESEDENA